MQKQKPIRIKKIRESARGQDCAAGVIGICNGNQETTVLAHYGEAGEKGMGLKPDDTSAAYLCSSCHDAMDGRVPGMTQGSREYAWFRAMRRTWRLLIENGVLK